MACSASCCAVNPTAARSQSKAEGHTQRSAAGCFRRAPIPFPRAHQTMHWLKSIFIGRARNLSDERLFHKISLVAVLAWVGLGADGLSSSCYGPEETFLVNGFNGL